MIANVLRNDNKCNQNCQEDSEPGSLNSITIPSPCVKMGGKAGHWQIEKAAKQLRTFGNSTAPTSLIKESI